MKSLSNIEITMFKRQLAMDNFDYEAQCKLKNTKVLVVGAGGLGSPALMYLVASGIGNICIMDDDTVSLTNLNRQILYTYENLGEKKTNVAVQRLSSLNPYTKITKLNYRLTHKNAMKIISEYDYILDCCDNLETRYLINNITRKLNKIFIHASMLGHTGQLAVFTPESCCYNCLYPDESNKSDSFYNSSISKSAIGVLAGVMGILQVSELIKSVTGIGNQTVNQLLVYNMLNQTIRKIPINRNSHCEICGQKIINYKPIYNLGKTNQVQNAVNF